MGVDSSEVEDEDPMRDQTGWGGQVRPDPGRVGSVVGRGVDGAVLSVPGLEGWRAGCSCKRGTCFD